MRSIFSLLLVLVFVMTAVVSPALARNTLSPGQKARINQRVKAMSPAQKQKAIGNLSARLIRLNNQQRMAKGPRKAQLAADIEIVELELMALRASGSMAPPPPPQTRPAAARQPAAKDVRMQQFGLAAGYIAGIPAILGEIRYHNPFDMVRTSMRLGAAYAEGEDTAGTKRKHALVVFDGIYRMTPPQAQGMRSYIGLGINFDAYTTGQQQGSVGGQAYYGVEVGRVWGGQMYLEVGYGLIQTGFSPDYTGLNALLGFKL